MGKQVLNDVHGSAHPTQKRDNAMPPDPEDVGRKSFIAGRAGQMPVEKAPEEDRQNRSTTEVFGEEGAGRASKE